MLCGDVRSAGGCPTCVADGVRLRHWAKSAQCPVCAIADTAWATTRPNVHNQSGSGIGQWAGSRWPDESQEKVTGDPNTANRPSIAPAPTPRSAEAFSLPPRRRSARRQLLFATVRALRGQPRRRHVPPSPAPAFCIWLLCPCRETANR
jgi:hypothetical protein